MAQSEVARGRHSERGAGSDGRMYVPRTCPIHTKQGPDGFVRSQTIGVPCVQQSAVERERETQTRDEDMREHSMGLRSHSDIVDILL